MCGLTGDGVLLIKTLGCAGNWQTQGKKREHLSSLIFSNRRLLKNAPRSGSLRRMDWVNGARDVRLLGWEEPTWMVDGGDG
jgi:hypothetical protein